MNLNERFVSEPAIRQKLGQEDRRVCVDDFTSPSTLNLAPDNETQYGDDEYDESFMDDSSADQHEYYMQESSFIINEPSTSSCLNLDRLDEIINTKKPNRVTALSISLVIKHSSSYQLTHVRSTKN